MNNDKDIRKQNKLNIKIDKEKIGTLYKFNIYQLDLKGKDHFITDYLYYSTRCSDVFKDSDIVDILKKGNFKPVMKVLCYKSKIVNRGRNCCIREFISRRCLPACIDSNWLYDGYKLSDGKEVPFFVYADFDALGNIAVSDEIESYIKKYLNDDSEYILDARNNINTVIDKLYENAKNDYLKVMDKNGYSEKYKMKELKEKYKSLF